MVGRPADPRRSARIRAGLLSSRRSVSFLPGGSRPASGRRRTAARGTGQHVRRKRRRREAGAEVGSALRALARLRRGHGIDPQPGMAYVRCRGSATDSCTSIMWPARALPKKRWRPSMPTSRKCRASRRKRSVACAAMYRADDKTCGYFTLHATADVSHSKRVAQSA